MRTALKTNVGGIQLRFQVHPTGINIITKTLSKWEIPPITRNTIEELSTLVIDKNNFYLTANIIADHQIKYKDLHKIKDNQQV